MPKIVVGEIFNFSPIGKNFVIWTFQIKFQVFMGSKKKNDKILIDNLFHLLITWEQNKREIPSN